MQARDAVSPPDWLSNRGRTPGEILFAIAHVAGGDWSARMLHACQRIQAAANALEEHDRIEMLATDVLSLLDDDDKNVFSDRLVQDLRAIEESGWKEYRPGGLTQIFACPNVEQLGIRRPRTVRVGSATAKVTWSQNCWPSAALCLRPRRR